MDVPSGIAFLVRVGHAKAVSGQPLWNTAFRPGNLTWNGA